MKNTIKKKHLPVYRLTGRKVDMNIQALLDYLNLNSEAIYNGVFRKSNKPVVVKCRRCKRHIKIPYSEKKWHWLNDVPILCGRCEKHFTDELMHTIAKTVFRREK